MPLHGFLGKAGSGKTSIAMAFEEVLDYRVNCFADNIREFIHGLNPIVLDKLRLDDLFDFYTWDEIKNGIINCGMDEGVIDLGEKRCLISSERDDSSISLHLANEVRTLLQNCGTLMVEMFGPNIWLDKVLPKPWKMHNPMSWESWCKVFLSEENKKWPDKLILHDVRRKIEWERIRELGGYIGRIVNLNLDNKYEVWRSHVTETEADMCIPDYTLYIDFGKAMWPQIEEQINKPEYMGIF